MITVSAAVICGVTRRLSAASWNVTVTVLFATTWDRNLVALDDLRLYFVLRRHPRMRQYLGQTVSLGSRQGDVEVERAVHRSQGQLERRRSCLDRQVDGRPDVLGLERTGVATVSLRTLTPEAAANPRHGWETSAGWCCPGPAPRDR